MGISTPQEHVQNGVILFDIPTFLRTHLIKIVLVNCLAFPPRSHLIRLYPDHNQKEDRLEPKPIPISRISDHDGEYEHPEPEGVAYAILDPGIDEAAGEAQPPIMDFPLGDADHLGGGVKGIEL
jgi:hypothetical protein